MCCSAVEEAADGALPEGQGPRFPASGLSQDDVDSIRLREENELLMQNLVHSKMELAETQSECPPIHCTHKWSAQAVLIIWLLHNLVEASTDLFRYLLLGDQLKLWELHPLVSYTICMILNVL